MASGFGGMETKTFAERLAALIPPAKSERAFAKEIGISPAGLRGLLHGGNSPTLDTLLAIAQARQVSIAWLAAGEGPKYVTEPVSEPASALALQNGSQAPYQATENPRISKDLLACVIERVMATYKELGIPLLAPEIGRISADFYNQINMMAYSPDEWPTFIDLLAVRLRKSIQGRQPSV